MRVYMKRNCLSLPIAAFVAMAASGSALAANSTNLDVNFTATIFETTCNMKLVGGTGSDTVQSLTIGNANGEVRLDDVRNNAATANFQIVLVECPASLSSLKTTVTGTPSNLLPTGLANSLAKGTGKVPTFQTTPPSPSRDKPHQPPLLSLTQPLMQNVWSGRKRRSRINPYRWSLLCKKPRPVH